MIVAGLKAFGMTLFLCIFVLIKIWIMKKWKVTFLLNGSNRAEEVHAHSNNEAMKIVRERYSSAGILSVSNAVEIR